MLSGEQVADAYRNACLTELSALKPGNVHAFAAGHGMAVADFEISAQVSASPMGRTGLSVGARILDAIERTQAAVSCNTNLGIVLLCAPLAQAALLQSGGKLRERLRLVLDQLDVSDAELAFQAIRLARPGGLGEAPEHNVREQAKVTLGAAMAAAGERDRIAYQYSSCFADVFDLGLPCLRAGIVRWGFQTWSTTATYLDFLSRIPDSHIARKHGRERALTVCEMARPLASAMQVADDPTRMAASLLALDTVLKAAGLNPGTTADLTVASLFALDLESREIGTC
jgi:triphosphoribosyl-dephospho-CoA synthase